LVRSVRETLIGSISSVYHHHKSRTVKFSKVQYNTVQKRWLFF
jgi:hypothetical protein